LIGQSEASLRLVFEVLEGGVVDVAVELAAQSADVGEGGFGLGFVLFEDGGGDEFVEGLQALHHVLETLRLAVF
jgi:hypothetical protein